MKSRGVKAAVGLSLLLLLTVFYFWATLTKNPTKDVTPTEDRDPIVVFAASSLLDALGEVAHAWKSEGGVDVVFNFDGTSRLAQQIKAGAPADLFFSADRDWMGDLEKAQDIVLETRVTLLSNRIVLIVPAKSVFVPQAPEALVDPRLKHLALAGESVPAGRFARAALRSTKTFDALQARLVNASNVRGALQWVAIGEAEAGIVFQTDALTEARVRVAYLYPETTHPKIEYPAAVLRNSSHPEEAQAFLQFCRSGKAAQIFKRAGFIWMGS